MQVKDLKQDGLSYEIEVTIPANDIDVARDAQLEDVRKQVNIKGFRKGMVPLTLVRQRYGKAIMGEVLEKVVNDSSAKVLKDKDLRPAMQPKIEVKTFDEGKDLVYTMAVEVLPTFELADFKGVKLEKLVAKPEDKDIQDALDRLAQNRKGTKSIETKRAAKKGDTVVIDFHGRTADDNKAHEGMHAHGHHLELGSGQFIPGFEDQLIGQKVGGKVEVKVTFPENYGAAELAGREAIFDVDIEDIREPAETEIDDEFAKSFGVEDLAALKKAIGEQLEKEFESNSRMTVKKSLLDFLDDAHKFDVPAGMLEMEHRNILDQLDLARQRSGGEKEELSEKEKSELKDIAERRVRLGLILSEIGNRNNLSVSDVELQKAVISEAQRYPGQEREVFDYYAKNRNALESFRAPLFEDKVVDYVLELAEVAEKTVSAEELMAALEDDEDEKPKKAKKQASSAKKADDKGKDDKKPAAKKKAPAKGKGKTESSKSKSSGSKKK